MSRACEANTFGRDQYFTATPKQKVSIVYYSSLLPLFVYFKDRNFREVEKSRNFTSITFANCYFWRKFKFTYATLENAFLTNITTIKSDKTISNAFSVSIFDLSIGDSNILRNTLDNPVSMAIDKLLRFSKKISKICRLP